MLRRVLRRRNPGRRLNGDEPTGFVHWGKIDAIIRDKAKRLFPGEGDQAIEAIRNTKMGQPSPKPWRLRKPCRERRDPSPPPPFTIIGINSTNKSVRVVVRTGTRGRQWGMRVGLPCRIKERFPCSWNMPIPSTTSN